jgi:hypothetical protein
MMITQGTHPSRAIKANSVTAGYSGRWPGDYLGFKVREYARPGDGSRSLLQGMPLHNSTIPHPLRKAVQVPKQLAHATTWIREMG